VEKADILNKVKASDLKVYGRLISYVFPYLPQFLISILGFAVFAGSQVAFAEWLKRVIDYTNNPTDDLRLIWPILLILIALVRGISFFIGNYLLASISNRLVHELRTDLFNKIPVLPSSFFDTRSSGHLVSRITFNVMQVTGAATSALKILIREGLLVIGLVSYLMFLNFQLASIFFLAAPFIALVVGFAGRRLRKISSRIQTAMGDVTHVASETISAYKEVKAFGGKDYEVNRFFKASDNNRVQNLKLEATNALASPLIQLLVSAALALITWLALDPSVLKDMSPGGFVAFFGAAGMLAKPVRQLSEINSQIQKGLAAASDIFEQLDEEPEKNEGTYENEQIKGLIEFKDLFFSYNQESPEVLTNINLTIDPGETVAFVGKSGAGKTSLVSLIPRFYDDFKGEISLDGISLEDYEINNLRSHISLVGQNITLFNDTVNKNISYGSIEEDFDLIQSASKKAHADEFVKAMPDGYETVVGDDGVLLSGGQRQRIAIARAILKDAPILILDEATSALDSESEEYIQDAMSELTKGRTTLVIAHRLSTIENADKIVVLEEGKIVEQGTHKELLKKGKHYASLHAKQFKDDLISQQIEIAKQPEDFDLGSLPVSKDHTPYLEKAWYNRSYWLWLLWPLSLVTKKVSELRLKKFLTGKTKSWKANIPLIVVGNIVAGGTGKTPFVIWLSKKLLDLGYKPGVISRGYGGKAKKYPLVMEDSTRVRMSGDEPKLIYQNAKVPVYVSPNRVAAAKQMIEETDCNVIISDDGLQHYQLNRDIEIVIFDGSRGIGNELCLPAGPLREPVKRIESVDFIVSSNKSLSKQGINENAIMKYKATEWVRLSDQKKVTLNSWPLGKVIHGVAGIGNPSKFFTTLKELNFKVIEHSFPDHYQFTEDDLTFSEKLPIVMTEKDAARCHKIQVKNIWVLKIEAELPDEFALQLVNEIKEKVK
jgi:subfamily B ATP-binding cassette protein MsbA